MATYFISTDAGPLTEVSHAEQIAIVAGNDATEQGHAVLGIDFVGGMITLGHWPDGETWEPLAVLGSPDGRWEVLSE